MAVVEEEVGRVAVRVAVVEVVGRVVDVVEDVSLPIGLLAEVEVADREVVDGMVFLSNAEPATLDRRSRVEDDFNGARVDAVPAIDMRLAVPEMPRFSSPELATDRGFSSAELLIEGRDRWEAVVEVLSGLRVVVVPVVGRVGGLFNVLEAVLVRVVEVAVLDAVEDEVGRLVTVAELETGRLVVVAVLVVDLAGDAGVFSLDASGLDLSISSLPDSTVESTGVAGGAISTSTSEWIDAGSSVEAILTNGCECCRYGKKLQPRKSRKREVSNVQNEKPR